MQLFKMIRARLAQPMGLLALTALVAGNMVGSGLFLLPASLSLIGTISLLSWIFTGAGALCLAYLFMRLSMAMPQKTGGPYVYVQASFGPFLGFQTAYFYWLSVWIGNAAIALATMGYIAVFYPIFLDPKVASLGAILLIWVLTIVNCFGVYLSSQLEGFTLIVRIVAVLFIVLFGIFHLHGQYYIHYLNVTQPLRTNFHAILLGCSLTLWAFIGLESATIPVERINNPKQTIPKATFLGVIIALIIYIATSGIIFGTIALPQLQHNPFPLAESANIIFGHWGEIFIAIAAIITCVGCLNGWILLQGQMPLGAANDQLFPPMFGQLNRYKVPARGIIYSSVFTTFLLLLTLHQDLIKQFEVIILLAIFATLMPYLYTTLAALVMPDPIVASRRKPFFYSIILISVLFLTAVILGVGEQILALGALLLLSSVPIYGWMILDCARSQYKYKNNK